MNTKAITMGIRRAISGIVASAIALSSIPAMAAENEKYPYTLFAASSEDGAITTTAYNFCVNGNVCTNGTIVANGNLNVNGTKTENAGQDMIYIFDKIDTKYFTTGNVDEHTEDYVLDEINININVPTEVLGETELTGNININTALKSFEDINLFGEVKNTNDSVIYSKYGDVIIDSTNVNLNGLVYAPFGNVEITAQNLNLNNVVIIADRITLDCPNVNANYSTNAGELVGTVSEALNIPKDEWQYMKDENGNGLPDFFEDIENWGKFADTDGDGLPDSIEEYLGSDANNIDTDNDGLNDYYEVFGTYTDPVLVDTDENGTTDGDEDFDKDSLTNHEEFLNETYPYTDDTDCDGLSDGDEFNVYNTDPLTSDTDGEGLLDGDEIVLGTDPLVQDTDADGTLDCDEKFNQIFTHKVANEDCAVTEVSVTMNCTGNINRTTTVESVLGKDYLCSEVVGLVGEPFEIETTSEFDTATITFKVDTEKLGDTEFDNLLFLWYDEENDEFVELETMLDEENDTASIVTTHFSKYMIVDSAAWFNAWRNAPDYREGEAARSVDTVITIDVSGSMSASDITAAVAATKNYIATMRDNDRLAIIKFSDDATLLQEMTEDKQALYDALKGLKSSGGTYYCKAIDATIDAFDNTTDAIKIAIFMSDGVPSDDVGTTLYDLIADSGVIFHCVGYGSSNKVLNALSEAGNGNVYTALTTDDLVAAYEEITLFSGMSTVDNDEDGLYDVLEYKGMILSNGNTIFTDPFKIDTDGDGLIDGLEIRLKKCNYVYHCFEFEMVDGVNPLAGDYANTGKSDYDRVHKTNVYGSSYLVNAIDKQCLINLPAGTVLLGYPNAISGDAFVVGETQSSANLYCYNIDAVVLASGEYWAKIKANSVCDVWGYIKLDDVLNCDNGLMSFTTKIGTSNQDYIYISPILYKDQSVFYNEIDFASGFPAGEYIQGELPGDLPASEEIQRYLFLLSLKMGMDYPLLLGIWCSESGASNELYVDGGTMGLTDKSINKIIDTGVWQNCKNNYKEYIIKLVTETYNEVYGILPSPNDISPNSIYYDSAVTCLLLTNSLYSWMSGGSNNNNTAWDAYFMYTDGFIRASSYAKYIRVNLGWDAIDYKACMSSACPENILQIDL